MGHSDKPISVFDVVKEEQIDKRTLSDLIQELMNHLKKSFGLNGAAYSKVVGDVKLDLEFYFSKNEKIDFNINQSLYSNKIGFKSVNKINLSSKGYNHKNINSHPRTIKKGK